MGEKIREGADNFDKHFKSYTEGTHRSRAPEETFSIVQKFFPVFGITRVANVTGLDVLGIPVVMVVRPNSRSLSVSQGKGLSLESARVSGVMESIEGYHAETLDIETRLLSHDDLLIHHRCVNINELPLNLYKPFSSEAKIPWVAGYDLIGKCETWIPYEIIHADYTHPLPFDSGYFITDSNGLASGNCIVEAINHAICEIIERDALTLWSLKNARERGLLSVALSSIDDPECARLIGDFARKGVNAAIWDITTDVDVPVYTCKIVQAQDADNGIRPAMGAGCHPCKAVALSRAMTEAAQSRLTFISGARDDQFRSTYHRYQSDKSHESWQDEIRNAGQGINFSDRMGYMSDTLEDDFEWLLKKLQTAGFSQAVFVDLTKEEFGIPVVKVIIPGLECHTAPEKRVLGARAKRALAKQGQEGEAMK